MTRVLGADRVPAGFTITTEACVAYMESGREPPEGLTDQVDEALAALERSAGKRLGDPDDPLLVSVRSGARVSMPRGSPLLRAGWDCAISSTSMRHRWILGLKRQRW